MELGNENLAIVLMAALALSEALALIPIIKSNGIFNFFINVLQTLVRKK